MTIHAAQALADDCLRLTRHQPHHALEWLVDDVLADFGVKPAESPPDDMHEWLFEHAGQYARAVFAHPFQDVLGEAYEAIASRGRRACLGQFFTPDAVAQLMGAMLTGNDPRHAQAREDGQLWTVCEPTCGSGALLLGFLDNLLTAHGPAALQHWSVTGIDLDRLCARMCAAQVLSNVFLHVSNGAHKTHEAHGSNGSKRSDEAQRTPGRTGIGELVIYWGNSLGPPEKLRVVIHAARRDLGADVVLPALHPARVAMLRQAQRQTQRDAADTPAPDSTTVRQASHQPEPTTTKARAPNRPSSGTPTLASVDITASARDHAPSHAAAPSRTHAACVEVNSPTPSAAAEQVDLFAD